MHFSNPGFRFAATAATLHPGLIYDVLSGLVLAVTISGGLQMARRSLRQFLAERKVRAPQDTMVGNAHRSREQGKCNRKQTA